MIKGWRDIQKASADVVTVDIDWTPFLPEAASAIAAHSVSVDVIDWFEVGFGDDLNVVGTAGVVAVDDGVDGLEQRVTLSGGEVNAFSMLVMSVTFDDGTQLNRALQVNVR
jgi:hypothetical protein